MIHNIQYIQHEWLDLKQYASFRVTTTHQLILHVQRKIWRIEYHKGKGSFSFVDVKIRQPNISINLENKGIHGREDWNTSND